MTKRDLPKYVTRHKRTGKLLFQRRYGGKMHQHTLETQFPEGADVPFELHQEIQRILDEPRPIVHRDTLASVIQRYMASDKYRKLAVRTQRDYEKRLAFLSQKLGHLPPRSVERHHVIRWMDIWAKDQSPHEANYLLRVLKIVMQRAIDYGLLLKGDDNPAKGVAEVQYEKQERHPWPPDLVAKMRETATGRELLAFELLLGTGQRVSDVLRMQWSHYDGEGIKVVQGKRKARLWLPVSQRLRGLLDASERRALFILPNQRATGQWAYRSASQALRKLREQIGAQDFDLHSLRYTATAELAAQGLDDETIMAVTGHKTAAMVQLYAGPARQRARAIKALKAREGE